MGLNCFLVVFIGNRRTLLGLFFGSLAVTAGMMKGMQWIDAYPPTRDTPSARTHVAHTRVPSHPDRAPSVPEAEEDFQQAA
jgi:hypothetical protein